MTKEEWCKLWGYSAGSPEGEQAWLDKTTFRPSRSSFYVRSDSIDPVRSMADGKMHDSLSSLYKSYRADGNPQGVNYQCIGNDVSPCTTFKPKERDDKKAHEAIERTLSDFGI